MIAIDPGYKFKASLSGLVSILRAHESIFYNITESPAHSVGELTAMFRNTVLTI